MLNRELHLFDLDNTLWDLQYKVWVIDKEDPGKPLFRISTYELDLIQRGIYRKDNLKVEYNDNTYYLNKDIVDKVKRKKNIPIDRIGISLIELTQKNYINTNAIEYLTRNVEHLHHQSNVDIVLLTGRADRSGHEKILNTLRLKLQELGLNIFKIYFVGSSMTDSPITIENRKCEIILEHLVGLKIENFKFIPKKQDIYNTVHFYDDTRNNIEVAKHIDQYLVRVLKNTENDLYYWVTDRLSNNEVKLFTHLVGTNLVQPFDTTEIPILAPLKFSIQENSKWKFLKNFNLFWLNHITR